MHVPHFAAYLLAGVITFIIPLTGPLERRVYRSNPSSLLKLVVYGINVASLWLLAGAAVWIDGWKLLLTSPAAGTNWLWMPTVSTIVLALAAAIFAISAILPLIQSLRGMRWRKAYGAAYRRAMSDIPGFLPNTTVERAAWIPMSLTAGICEEVLCRGFLIRFLHESDFGLPVFGALIVSSFIFGVAHLYQGTKAVLGTGITGAGLGLLFLVSNNLMVSIIVHILADLQVPFILRPIRNDAGLVEDD